MERSSDEQPSPVPLGLPLLLFFVSGFAGLTYEILWQRELGLLFGNTSQAAATTLAVFFLGVALGSWWLGRRCGAWRHPLRAFAWLEIATGVSALLLLILLPVYRALFAPLYGALGDAPIAFLAVKFLLSAVVLGPSAVLMGATLPVLAEWATRRGGGFARSGILLYAINTAGAVAGAFLAGFVLPRVLGYRGAYLVAVGASLAVGLAALSIRARPESARPPALPGAAAVPGRLLLVALCTGFAALALEVLWTRMTALVVVNSVYSFAAVLTAFLVALVLGAVAARLLARRVRDAGVALRVLLLLAGIATVFSGRIFRAVAGTPPSVGQGEDWGVYTASLAGLLSLTVIPAAFAAGLVFPFLLRVEDARAKGAAGPRLGRLAAANTLGALLGALAAGFLLPGLLGLWAATSLTAVVYALALVAAPAPEAHHRALGFGFGLVLVAAAVSHGFVDAGVARRWGLRADETLLASYEGSAGLVRVVDRDGDLKLRLDSGYTLGGTAEPRWEHYQAHIPLCLHPAPKRVFFLGMGTGITAGAALHHDVEQLRVAEIVPEAVQAAREHFAPWVNGLFRDERATVIVEDARTLLVGSEEHYDVIVGDLFLPWRRGTALLYTREQFHAVKARMAPGGVFAQWLPLYQMSEEAWRGVLATFVDVFGEGTVWRGDFFSKRPIVALVARNSEEPLDPQAYAAAWQRLEDEQVIDFEGAIESLPFMFYAGPVAATAESAGRGRLLTDSDPWLEFLAPIEQRRRVAGTAAAFVGTRLAALQQAVRTLVPVEDDPFLARCSRAQRRYVRGGLHLYAYAVHAGGRDANARSEAWAGYLRTILRRVQPELDEWVR